MWINFRYEKLAIFCYDCGVNGHDQGNCRTQNPVIANKYGAWLSSNPGITPLDLIELIHSQPSLKHAQLIDGISHYTVLSFGMYYGMKELRSYLHKLKLAPSPFK